MIGIFIGIGWGTTVSGDYREPRYRYWIEGDAVILEVEVPGVGKEGITVELIGESTVKVTAVGEGRKYLLIKELPSPVDYQGATARYNNGLLIIKLPIKGGKRVSVE